MVDTNLMASMSGVDGQKICGVAATKEKAEYCSSTVACISSLIL